MGGETVERWLGWYRHTGEGHGEYYVDNNISFSYININHFYDSNADGYPYVINEVISMFLPKTPNDRDYYVEEILSCLNDPNSTMVLVSSVMSVEAITGECSDIITNYFSDTILQGNGELSSNRNSSDAIIPDDFS